MNVILNGLHCTCEVFESFLEFRPLVLLKPVPANCRFNGNGLPRLLTELGVPLETVLRGEVAADKEDLKCGYYQSFYYRTI